MSHYVWNASLVLADYIASGKIDAKGESVLELGAGAGLLGILCAKQGAQTVCLSDYPDDAILENLRHNVSTNLNDSDTQRCFVVGHQWGDQIDDLLHCNPAASPTQYGLILFSDCLWISSQHFALLTTLHRLIVSSNGRPKIFMACGIHTGYDCINRFIELAVSEHFGFRVNLMEKRRVGGWAGQGEDAKAEVDDVTDRNRTVLLYEMLPPG